MAFDVKLEPGYHFLHEWRDNTVTGAKAYSSGPMVEIKNGALICAGRNLRDCPANAWMHIELSAKIGEGRDNTFDLTLTLPGGQPQRFEKLPFASKTMNKLDWVGFISPGKDAAKAWLDEIVIDFTEAQ